MELIYNKHGREVWFEQIQRPFSFCSPFTGREFVLMLYQAVETVSIDEFGLSDQFVEQGCRHAVCAGYECSKWDDAIDYACVMAEIEGRELPFVMTTWIENQPVEEAIEYFVRFTDIDERIPEHYVVVILGGDDEIARSIRSAVVSGFENEKHWRLDNV